MHADAILLEYDALVADLQACVATIETVLRKALSSQQIKVHSLDHRVKSRASLAAKLRRPERTYSQLADITDLIGLRVTTYFEASVEDVARIVERCFAVDYTRSVDKRQSEDHNRFGYRSIHYVCGSDALPGALHFEVQVRTVLQHAWAEIEHDLGYKSSEEVPTAIKRRFSRIASLLEVADEEFGAIRRDLQAYKRDVEAEARSEPERFALDHLTLESLTTGGIVADLDREIATRIAKPIDANLFYPEYLVKMLRLAGTRSLADVVGAAREHREAVLDLVAPYFSFAGREFSMSAASLSSVQRGYSLFFLAHVLVLKSSMLGLSKVDRFATFYRQLDYPNEPRRAFQVASSLIEQLDVAMEQAKPSGAAASAPSTARFPPTWSTTLSLLECADDRRVPFRQSW